jgi:hypothetical protein
MRKAEAHVLWDRAATLADAAMKRLEDDAVVERAVIPDTDDAIAKECLREAIRMALGPGNVNDRLAAARLVLTYTKPRPASVVETQELLAANGHAERLLAALLGSQ